MRNMLINTFASVFALISVLAASETTAMEKKYQFNLVDAPHLSSDKFLPGYGVLIYDLNERYIFDGTTTHALSSCKRDPLMMCFDGSPHGFLLYLPRDKKLWTTWKRGDETYVLESWKRYPFMPAKTQLAAIHVFANETLDDRKNNGGVSYPIATYFIDKNTRLVGMMRYVLGNPKHRGLNDNYIESFYWAKDEGLPLADF